MDPVQYDIFAMNTLDEDTYLSGDPLIMLEDGSDASDLIVFNTKQLTFEISTKDEKMVGPQRAILRSCDRLDRLLEMNLSVQVKQNTAPDFLTAVQTEFTMAVNEVIEYALPDIIDYENNDQSEVYINYLSTA